MINWNEFDQFERICDTYLPARGEGETMATQIVTAITKLVYKFYNDGDVFDNTYHLDGWANDLSSYANWLFTYINLTELEDIRHIKTEDDYSVLLFKIANKCMNEEYLEQYKDEPKKGSIYNCDGPFEFSEEEEEEEDDWYDEDEDKY